MLLAWRPYLLNFVVVYPLKMMARAACMHDLSIINDMKIKSADESYGP
jgi:ABC-type siderophore export system fused ATPase/permease subunit